ncbi:unnamed protein product, partial [Tilletia controversa]
MSTHLPSSLHQHTERRASSSATASVSASNPPPRSDSYSAASSSHLAPAHPLNTRPQPHRSYSGISTTASPSPSPSMPTTAATLGRRTAQDLLTLRNHFPQDSSITDSSRYATRTGQHRSLSGGIPSPASSAHPQDTTPTTHHFAHYTTASPVATPAPDAHTEDPMNTSASAVLARQQHQQQQHQQQHQQQQRRAMTASPGAAYALESQPAATGAGGAWQSSSTFPSGTPEGAAPTPRRSDTMGAPPPTSSSSTTATNDVSTTATRNHHGRSSAGATVQRAATMDVAAENAAYHHHHHHQQANAYHAGKTAAGGVAYQNRHYPGTQQDELSAPFRSMTLAGMEHHQHHHHQAHQGHGGGFYSPPAGATYALTMSPPMNPISNIGNGNGNGNGSHHRHAHGHGGHAAHPSISYGYHPAEPFTLGSPHLLASQSPEPFLPPVAGMSGLPPSVMHQHQGFHHGHGHGSAPQTPQFGTVPMQGSHRNGSNAGTNATTSPSVGVGYMPASQMSPVMMPTHPPYPMMMSPGSPMMGMPTMDKK